MRINLSLGPIVLRYDAVAEQMREFSLPSVAVIPSAGLQQPNAHDHLKVEESIKDLFGLAIGPLNREAKAAATALVTLASEGHLMLPYCSRPQLVARASHDQINLSGFIKQVNQVVEDARPGWIGKKTHLELMLATDCREARNFDIHAFAELHSWLMANGKMSEKFSLATAPYVLLRALMEIEGTDLAFDTRHNYILWRASGLDRETEFRECLLDKSCLSGMRVHGQSRERVELGDQIARRKDSAALKHKVQSNEKLSNTPYIKELLRIAALGDPSSPARYFGALSGGSHVKGFREKRWLEKPSNYPGRSAVNVASIGHKWFVTFRAYLTKRQKDHEKEEEVRYSLHILADYVLLYLPWWLETHPSTSVEFPESPKDFLRYLFFDRTRFASDEEDALGDLPQTLSDLLESRRPTPASRNTFRIMLRNFFSFVITYFEDSSEYTTRGSENPIRLDFDKEVAERPGKTNKVPFAEEVFPFLVHYGQALVAFGEFLQQAAYEKNVFRKAAWGRSGGYNTAEWGFMPVFWFRGRLYRLDWTPNIFSIHKRGIESNPRTEAGIYVHGKRINQGLNRSVSFNIPCLATVRLLTVLVETGMRGQSIQWLDRRTFDSLASKLKDLSALHGDPLGQTFHSLFVNTDKTHEEWQNLVSHRVRRTLLAEGYFQNSLTDASSHAEVPYEGRVKTRFRPVLPLFRSHKGSRPISDSTYSQRWVEFLFGFQTFYNSRDGHDRRNSEDALVLLKEKEGWEEGAPPWAIYQPVHTPHSCRSTYATLKDGDLEVSEICEQLGQSNTVVTNRYQLPAFSKLVAKLTSLDARAMGHEIYDASGQGPAYLHPEAEESSVRRAFVKDRAQAMSDFGFVPGVALWSLSELDGDSATLELLRQSPASAIRWHATHVCPVGNQCPKEIVANAGGMSRCGICPLAAKCVDHLPAIEAKQNELHERIRTNASRQRSFEERKAVQGDIDALHKEMQIDTKELMGWRLSAEIVRSRLRELGTGAGYHVDQPELVRKQLELVTRNDAESAFFLQRISDVNAYPSLESPEVRARAAKYTRLLLARQGRLKDAALLDVPAHDEITVFVSLVKPFIEAKGLTLEQIALAIDELPRLSNLSETSATPLLT